jgi:hypothetical protein
LACLLYPLFRSGLPPIHAEFLPLHYHLYYSRISHTATKYEKKSELLPIVFPAKFLLNTCTWNKKETPSISLVINASGLLWPQQVVVEKMEKVGMACTDKET